MNNSNYKHVHLKKIFRAGSEDFEPKQHGIVLSSPAPLTFDRANEGKPFTNDFIFAQLPIEITWQIVQSISEADLASLALVNTDCRQMARSRQFAAISLDYSQQASDLLEALYQEGKERVSSNGQTRKPALGPCIRHIKVRTNPRCVSSRHSFLLGRESLNFTTSEDLKKVDEVCAMIFSQYLSKITSILSEGKVFPHLESLRWHDTFPIYQPTMRAIITSGARDITMRWLELDESFTLDLPPAGHIPCIRSLDMHLLWMTTYHNEPRGNVSPLISEILRLVAPTIETLNWKGHHSKDYQPLRNEHPDGQAFFPRLRNLSIQFGTDYDSNWLDLLICPGQRSPIESLEINLEKFPSTKKFFRTCGTLPRLETLVVCCRGQEVLDLSFLRSNNHIKKLAFVKTLGAQFLDQSVLPLLSQSFHNLTSLRLQWSVASISQRALDIISTLGTLDQLYLGVGVARWPTWLVDHSALRDSLRSLSKLRKLVLYGDTYPLYPDLGFSEATSTSPSAYESYYQLRRPRTYHELLQVSHQDESTDNQLFDEYVKEKWEEQHRQDMMGIVEQYAGEVLSLEWIFVGQLPMSIQIQKNGSKRVVLLSEKRNDGGSMFYWMFGCAKHTIRSMII